MAGKKYGVLDLFAGAGGFSQGFRGFTIDGECPFETVGYVEIDKNAAKTLISALVRNGVTEERANDIVICDDITSPETKRRLYSVCPEVDIIIGGPPCQSFSTIGPRVGWQSSKYENDDRDSLFYHYLAIVEYYKPLMFVFENVTGILSKKVSTTGRKFIDIIIQDFEELGYSLEVEDDKLFSDRRYMVLNAADYGVPQIRERVIIIGNRIGIKNPIPEKTHCTPDKCPETGLLPYVTLEDAIGDLPFVVPKITLTPSDKKKSIKDVSVEEKQKNEALNVDRNNGADITTYHWERFWEHYNNGNESRRRFLEYIMPKSEDALLTAHMARGQQQTDIVLFRGMKPGTSSKHLLLSDDPEEKKLLSLIKYEMKSFFDKYKKLSWDKPCHTIFAHLQRDGNRFIHPDSEQERTLTVREAARIQSFPDNYVIESIGNTRFKYIGNAVPPLMAKAIAKAVCGALQGVTRKHGRGFRVVSKPSEGRSHVTAAIKNRDTKPEVILRKALFAAGLRFRLKEKIKGSPDIAFLGRRIAVFVDGCFWHGCPRCYKEPVANREFWAKKVETNHRRDAEVDAALQGDGWTVLRIWEHEIKKDLQGVVQKIVELIGEKKVLP